MGYVAVTGGKEAIQHANRLVTYFRLREADEPLTVQSVEKQLRLLIDKVMSEGGLYAPEYAALAIKQAEGDPFEAAFLLRAYRSTLPRNHYSLLLKTDEMRLIRRISSSFRDIPGGQLLGPTYDYIHRLLRFSLREEGMEEVRTFLERFMREIEPVQEEMRFHKVTDMLGEQGYLESCEEEKEERLIDITRENLTFPTTRSARMQALARGETGAMVSFAYSSMRGYGAVHPTIAELRVGYAPIYVPHPYLQAEDDAIYIGEILLTEVETINAMQRSKKTGKPVFQMGYGLVFGQNEAKAISMAILEKSMESEGASPSQNEEFLLLHIDGIESSGFVSHLKLPHYVTFQSSLDRIRKVKEE